MSSLQFIKKQSASDVTAIEVTDCFNENYDLYKVCITKTDVTVQTYSYIRLLDSNNNDIGDAEYKYAQGDYPANAHLVGGQSSSANFLCANIDISGTDLKKGIGQTFWVHRPYNSDSYTYAQGQSSGYTTIGYMTAWYGVHASLETIKGIRYYRGSGNFDSVEVVVYGVK